MKISLKWLAAYVELPANAQEVARRLTAAGLEIEGMESPAAALEGVRVAQIRESVPHPNADKLSVAKVDVGGPSLVQVVCGAKNYKVGDKVPLATVGAKLASGVEIKQAALRGVDSFGMLCSARELGLAEEAAGLLILSPEAVPGTPVAQALGLDDVVLEVNVTPNRPDALSHLGIARELSVLTGKPLQVPPARVAESAGLAKDKVRIQVEDAERCPRYAARVIEGVTVKPSPPWLQDRLKSCGVRAINNLVDVTNFVLLESGQPLHAFDLDKVAGAQIVVRTAKKGERLKTLDGKARALDPDDLVIADARSAQALAGVMGGGDSEVTEGTRRVLLESAHFQPSGVRRTAKRHGLHTEASHRFERGADLDAVLPALDRAAALMAELSGGTVAAGQLDVHGALPAPRRVELRFSKVASLLGVEVPEPECRRILAALCFRTVSDASGSVAVEVPRARVDVEREEDLVEEVARVFGYDRIPARLPRSMASLAAEPAAAELDRRLRQALSGAGLDEVLNYSFVAPHRLETLGAPSPAIQLVNPLSVEQSAMRTTLLSGLLENLSLSVRHQVESVRLYEVGRVYLVDAQGGQGTRAPAREEPRVAGLLWGLRSGRTWAEKDARVDFFDAKGGLERVFRGLGMEGVRFQPAEAPAYHPRACAELRAQDGTVLGYLGELHPRVTKAFSLPPAVFAFELALAPLEAGFMRVPQARPLPRFPAVLRDLAVVVPRELNQESVRQVIREVGGGLVEDALVFDVYTGKPIPEGKKNLAYAIRYRAQDRTLTDAEVTAAHQQIVDEVNARLGGALRT